MTAIFDAHFHVIDPGFPLVPNQGYLPPAYTVADYRAELAGLGLDAVAGVVVSGSFQAADTGYLVPALRALGPAWRAVVNLDPGLDDAAIGGLHALGVRAIRVNLKRGAGTALADLEREAARVWDLAGWHVEFYLDAALVLPELRPALARLPKIAIDHLGLSAAGLDDLVALAGGGAAVKATGFSRFDGDVAAALRRIHAANPAALMFGSDLPSTRAPARFGAADMDLLGDAFAGPGRDAVLRGNGAAFYGLAL
ncbi:MAG: amidohydrolase family protein [Sneathiellaceae bacterium]